MALPNNVDLTKQPFEKITVILGDATGFDDSITFSGTTAAAVLVNLTDYHLENLKEIHLINPINTKKNVKN